MYSLEGDDITETAVAPYLHELTSGRSGGVTAGTVLVIDDEPAIVSLLRRGLEAEGFVVQTAANGREGLELARRTHPDVVILDLMLPEVDGFDVCRALRALQPGPELSIIMLTARTAPRDKVLGLELGADDYVTKPFHFAELLARIRVQLRRHGSASSHVVRFSHLTLETDSRTVTWDGTRLTLTAKEFDLLEVLMRNPRRVLTRDRIAEEVWGNDFEAESNVIDVYIRRLRRKLEEVTTTPLIHTVRGVGYVLTDEPRAEGLA